MPEHRLVYIESEGWHLIPTIFFALPSLLTIETITDALRFPALYKLHVVTTTSSLSCVSLKTWETLLNFVLLEHLSNIL